MSQNRVVVWAFLALSSAALAIACVDGSAPSSAGPAEGMSPPNAGSSNAGSGAVAVGPCLDTQSDPAHCGSCTTACAQGQICAQGVCKAPVTSCTAPQTLCSGACVDLTSTGHCGSCGNACVTGQTCTAGACQCPGSQTACNGACTDTQTNNDNCGACNQACATGATCVAGQCGCATGQTQCSGVCVDVQRSDANCGACGQACGMGSTCSGGTCVTGAGADGCSGKALGITLKQISVYQTVKVGVMDAGAEVASDKRTTDVVTGRQTLFRVSVAVDSGFAPRSLSARITINNGTMATEYFAKQTISKDSVDTDTMSTFQVFVPPEQITVDTRYSAELVECGMGATGTAGANRFPETGDIALGARRTGGLKVSLVPLLSNGKVPDTSETALAGYKQQLMAMYPIDSVEFTVLPQVSIGYPVDWEGTLDQMRSKRKTDNPAADVYYFGLLKPQETFSQFCGNACTTGIGYVGDAKSGSYRVALGVGYADRTSAQTMAHELGHNHGRNHAPCVPNGGSISGVDQNYPFPDGRTGILGFDSRTKVLLSAEKSTDMMGYCNNVWLSEYTYGGLADRIATVNGSTGSNSEVLSPAAVHTWRVLLVGSKGPRWGIPITRPSPAEGTPVTARILDGKGALLSEVEVYRTEISDSGSATLMVPEPKSDWISVQVPGFPAIAFQ